MLVAVDRLTSRSHPLVVPQTRYVSFTVAENSITIYKSLFLKCRNSDASRLERRFVRYEIRNSEIPEKHH
ncbi:hypothetical protein HSR121_0027 [Halapricum desulfuricans]|uniref:Uncharacterized protein n=1 Tax=Halapricum desulfuricans TaxID=2841257 RepID=A0A897MWN5_9EURY|nr:hypothetical protein HSR121_0027 [Halapricum desulfuricans]